MDSTGVRFDLFDSDYCTVLHTWEDLADWCSIQADYGDRFTGKVRVDPDTGCWRWTAAHTRAGYGSTTRDGVRQYPHRIAYAALHGPIPEGLVCHHVCGNRECVRPDPAHVILTTRAQNNRARMGASHDSGRCVNGVRKIGTRYVVWVGAKYVGGSLEEAERAAIATRAEQGGELAGLSRRPA